ncbi:MAG: primase C-terminal domain-containing protein [Clostridia bacterium]|nr:primase C-terminal domain-containing protein [Clostridia bacterium]
MNEFVLYRSDGAGNAKNTVYPILERITDSNALYRALCFDHVCAKYRDDRRSEANFMFSNVIPMDCDNDHSEDPSDWKTPDDVRAAFPGAAFGVGYSRSNMKVKDGKAARPKFHVYFPIKPVTDAKQYAAMKQRILRRIPWFDANAVDAARFYFGSPDNRAFIVPGKTTVDALIEQTETACEPAAGPIILTAKELPPPEKRRTILRGERNSTLSRLAGNLIKRYGDTEEARKKFMEEAAACVPPLPRDELRNIWSSARKYGEREAAKPGYIPPEEFNKPSAIMEFLKKARPESNPKYAWSDIGNGRLFADCFKDAARYVSDRKTWFMYADGVWAPDVGGMFVTERCKELADELMRYALTIADDRMKQEYLKHCMRWQSHKVRETVLKDAQSVYSVKACEFDTDQYVLNCKNGTLHLDKQVNSQNASEDVARLVGIRFANISEPGKGLMLNAALVKTMTGNDTINARFLHENSFDFKPQFKLYINTNYLPTINDMTLFNSGRIILIPFDRQFNESEQDKGLKKRFEMDDARSAVLNWLIEGYLKLQKEGFCPPESVKAAIKEYMQESDKISQFIEEALVARLDAETKTALIYEKYREWCDKNGCYAENSRNFNQELRRIGKIVKKRPKGGGGTTSVLLGFSIIGVPSVL